MKIETKCEIILDTLDTMTPTEIKMLLASDQFSGLLKNKIDDIKSIQINIDTGSLGYTVAWGQDKQSDFLVTEQYRKQDNLHKTELTNPRFNGWDFSG